MFRAVQEKLKNSEEDRQHMTSRRITIYPQHREREISNHFQALGTGTTAENSLEESSEEGDQKETLLTRRHGMGVP